MLHYGLCPFWLPGTAMPTPTLETMGWRWQAAKSPDTLASIWKRVYLLMWTPSMDFYPKKKFCVLSTNKCWESISYLGLPNIYTHTYFDCKLRGSMTPKLWTVLRKNKILIYCLLEWALIKSRQVRDVMPLYKLCFFRPWSHLTEWLCRHILCQKQRQGKFQRFKKMDMNARWVSDIRNKLLIYTKI